jgi:hypothetical protein
MDYFASANQHNTKVDLPTLGAVELRYISGGDILRDYEKILSKPASAKVQVQKILHHQLLHPKITLARLELLPDEELESMALAFVKNEQSTFKHYKDTGDVYKDFITALNTDREELAKEFQARLQPMFDSIQKTVSGLGNVHNLALGAALKNASQFSSMLGAINKVDLSYINKISLHPSQLLQQYSTMADIISKSLAPQINTWAKWAEQNRRLFETTQNVWAKYQAEYRIAEKDAAKVLRKYKWFISPSIPISLIFQVYKLDKKDGRQDKAVNQLFIRYFEADDWQALEYIASGWSKSPFFKSRYKIIVDCVLTVKSGSKASINVSNVVLPTLIIQIDGILNDYMRAKGLSYIGYNGRNTVLQTNPLPVSLPAALEDVASEVFLNILFQRSQTGQPLATPYNFNRHKILHAEKTAYGRKDYLIRAFMVLDLLASLR